MDLLINGNVELVRRWFKMYVVEWGKVDEMWFVFCCVIKKKKDFEWFWEWI